MMAVTWTLVRMPTFLCFAPGYLSLVPVGHHGENTDTAALGIQWELSHVAEIQVAKCRGQVAMELRDDYSCLRKTLDGAREQVQRHAWVLTMLPLT